MDEDAVGGAVDERPEPRFALPQAVLGLPPVGDVLQGPDHRHYPAVL